MASPPQLTRARGGPGPPPAANEGGGNWGQRGRARVCGGACAFLPCCVWVMVARAKRIMPKGYRSWSEWVMRPEPKRRGFERDGGMPRGLEAVARKHGGPVRAAELDTCNAKTAAMYQCHSRTCTTALQLSTKLCALCRARTFVFEHWASGPKIPGQTRCICLYSPSQPHGGDRAGSAHTVKAPAFPIPLRGAVLVYSLR